MISFQGWFLEYSNSVSCLPEELQLPFDILNKGGVGGAGEGGVSL